MRQLTLFDVLTPTSEGNDVEFKAARGGLPGAFWETYSAMANTQGGRVILGVAEKQGVLSWDGVPDAAALRTVLWNQLNDRNKISANMSAPTRWPAPTAVPKKATTDAVKTKCVACWPTSLPRPLMQPSSNISASPISTPTPSSSTAIASPPATQTTRGCLKTTKACCTSSARCGGIAPARYKAPPWRGW